MHIERVGAFGEQLVDVFMKYRVYMAASNFGELIAAQGRLARPAFTADSRFVVFSIEPAKAELNKAKKAGRSPTVREGAGTTASRDADMPKNALGIMDLSNGQVAKIDRVKNFQAPEELSPSLRPNGKPYSTIWPLGRQHGSTTKWTSSTLGGRQARWDEGRFERAR